MDLVRRLSTSLVISRLNYFNAVLSGILKCSSFPFQLVFNMAARFAYKLDGRTIFLLFDGASLVAY